MAQFTRKPLIYLAVILPILWIGAMALLYFLLNAYHQFSGAPLNAIPNKNGLLIVLPALFLWIPLSLFLSNLVLYVIAPLRRIAQRYERESHHPGFLESQRALLKLAGLVGLICIPLMALGFLL
jgi:hypothetical protein